MPLLTTLASFGNASGSDSRSSLIMDAAGNLYGTTTTGGSLGGGTIFKLLKTGLGYSTTPVVLASFGGAAGDYLMSGLAFDAARDLFGTTLLGGKSDQGTIYELAQSVIAHPGWAVSRSFDGVASTLRKSASTERPFALAVLTTDRNAA